MSSDHSQNNSTSGEGDDQTSTEKTAYELLGGEARVRELVDLFYDRMALEPQFEVIRKMHPDDMGSSRDKLFWFLSGWLGGPDLFVERFGHPRLRARHLPFSIGIEERDQWLTCMAHALTDLGIKGDFFDRLMQSFYGTADWMRNRQG
jgi:hemoglobin